VAAADVCRAGGIRLIDAGSTSLTIINTAFRGLPY
jgi:hypothetical protein